jgi:hypothetical protein
MPTPDKPEKIATKAQGKKVQGSEFKGYNILVLHMFLHDAQIDPFHPLGETWNST